MIDSINNEDITKSEDDINVIDDEDENNCDDECNNNVNNFPKLRFFDFIFNNIYSLKECNINKQEIILKCNEIIAEYFSIENIIYNQIKLGNLLRDYNWNKAELSKFDNNELIIQLKNLIHNAKIK